MSSALQQPNDQEMATAEPLQLRRAVAGDEPAVQALVFSVLREFGLLPDPKGADADLRDIPAHYFNNGGDFYVLVEVATGTIVGTVGLMPCGDKVAELRKMYLAPQYRGQGWGRKLLETILQVARKHGFHTVRLETNSVLKDAIRLYTRYGFARVNQKPHSKRSDQVFELRLC